MANTSDQIKDLVKKRLPENSQLIDFIQANEKYEKLVKEGMILKRGYNIMTTGEIYNSISNNSYCQKFH
jgi:hypothetical protein